MLCFNNRHLYIDSPKITLRVLDWLCKRHAWLQDVGTEPCAVCCVLCSEMSLMEANPFNLDSTIGTVYFNVHDRIREFGKRQLEVFNFSGVPGVRLQHSKHASSPFPPPSSSSSLSLIHI